MPTPAHRRRVFSSPLGLITQGLTNAYRCDAGAGTSLADSVGGQHGVFAGTVTWAAEGISLAGSGRVTLPFRITAVPFTVQIVHRATSTGTVIFASGSASDASLDMAIINNRQLAIYDTTPSTVEKDAGGTASTNTWEVLTGMASQTQEQVFVNTTQNGSTTALDGSVALRSGANNCTLGAYSDPSFAYSGKIAYLLIYNRQLSAAEIAANYAVLKTTLAPRGVTLP